MKLKQVLPMSILLAATALYGADKPLDFWDEELRLFGISLNGGEISPALAARQDSNYASKFFSLDHGDRKVGDLSIVFNPAAAKADVAVGVDFSLWGQYPDLAATDSLHLFVKAENTRQLEITLLDAEGGKAVLAVALDEAGWNELRIPIDKFGMSGKFSPAKLRSCLLAFKPPLDKPARIDGIWFEDANGMLKHGVTDKPLAQRMSEAKASRTQRIESAFQKQAGSDFGNLLSKYYAQLYIGKQTEAANNGITKELDAELAKIGTADCDLWDLFLNPMLCRLYYDFGHKGTMSPGRLSADNEKKLLALLWARLEKKNDIHWARQSTWWVDGSENHDLNAKVSCLVSSRIFMDEPEYRDRAYPDLGQGGAYGYGHAGYHGKELPGRKDGGLGQYADGREYRAASHYYAWVAYFKQYFSERAKHGFFIERSSKGYMKHTLNFIDIVYRFGGDEKLRSLSGQFIDLVWADWAMESVSGIRGGPKTRHHRNVGGYGSMTELICFHLGAPGNGFLWWYWSLVSGYELPPIIWEMALDRTGMGVFEYRSRGIGEEVGKLPRPPGTERSLVINPDSRFLKYSYVAPEYVLGTQMDHPLAIHSHLSVAGRWQGLVVADTAAARIVPLLFKEEDGKVKFENGCSWRNFQHKNVLITQKGRGFTRIDPDWFPEAMDPADFKLGIYIGAAWDDKLEKDGWVFLRKGVVHAAVRAVAWNKVKAMETKGTQIRFNSPIDSPTVDLDLAPYAWNEEGTIITPKDNFSPMIIKTGRRADSTFEEFVSTTLSERLELYKTVVPGSHILVYESGGDEYVFNAGTLALPLLNGKPVDYQYPLTFDSPYMKSIYGSGVIELKKGDKKLVLDLSGRESWWQRLFN